LLTLNIWLSLVVALVVPKPAAAAALAVIERQQG
jgi:hypothetical protein